MIKKENIIANNVYNITSINDCGRTQFSILINISKRLTDEISIHSWNEQLLQAVLY